MQMGSPVSVVECNSIKSLSGPTSFWMIIQASVISRLQITWRYLPNLLGVIIELSLRALFFLLLSSIASFQNRNIAGQVMTGRDLFIFFQGGLLLFIFIRATLWRPIGTITDDLYNGTLEYLYSAPSSRYAYYVGTVLSEIIISLPVVIPLYLFLVVYSRTTMFNMSMVLITIFTIQIALTALGILVALLALLWRQVHSLALVIGLAFEFLAGAYLPVNAFPKFLQWLAYLLPYTWGYDLIRYYSFGGKWQPLLPVWQEWSLVLLYAVCYTGISQYLLKKAEQRAKKIGLHVI
ncbi:MAG: ABC transporter permease [bacterium]|nr:ABC transporter permease [bacterium]